MRPAVYAAWALLLSGVYQLPDRKIEQWERVIDRSALRASERIKRVVRERYYRPIQSEKVPIDQQLNEYALMRDNPSVLAQFFKDQRASPESVLEYLEKMEGLAGNPR